MLNKRGGLDGLTADCSYEMFLEIIDLTAFKNRESFLLKRVDRQGHIVKTKNQHRIFSGFIDKGIHVLNIEADFLDTVKHRRQSTGSSGTSTAITVVLPTVNPFSFSAFSASSTLSTISLKIPKSAVSATERAPDIDIVFGQDRCYFSQASRFILQKYCNLFYPHDSLPVSDFTIVNNPLRFSFTALDSAED